MDNYSLVRSLTFPVVASALGWNVTQFKRSKADFVGPCNIHNSKSNKTCFRYHESGKFHCFSCNIKGAGAIDLVKLAKQIGFKDAVAFLEALSASAPAQEPAKEKSPVLGDSETSVELKPFTGKYHLHQADCAWLNARCADKAVRERYGVFFYQNNARKSNVNGHVLIPIRDLEGVNYGYLARNIGEVTPERPKYRLPANLPKSRFVFGGDQLRTFGSLPLRVVYLVESPFACLRFATLGFPAVSPYGWSVAPEQIELLAHLAKGIVYLPDRNKHHECASSVQALGQKLWLRFPPLPAGIDDPEAMTREQVLAL